MHSREVHSSSHTIIANYQIIQHPIFASHLVETVVGCNVFETIEPRTNLMAKPRNKNKFTTIPENKKTDDWKKKKKKMTTAKQE